MDASVPVNKLNQSRDGCAVYSSWPVKYTLCCSVDWTLAINLNNFRYRNSLFRAFEGTIIAFLRSMTDSH